MIILFISNPSQAKNKKPLEVSLMAYNVENLFDATDDGAQQGDVTFLPMIIKHAWPKDLCLNKETSYQVLCEKLDWTQSKYEIKLQKIASVLMDYDSKGADIISLEELENHHVISDLWTKHLMSRGYKTLIHFESHSARGIDVGILSKFPLAEPAIVHPVDLSGVTDHATRDIIEVRFMLPNGKELRVTANHWPSQNNMTEARLKAAAIEKQIAERARKDGVPLVAMGDFNTIVSETPNPIKNNIADTNLNARLKPFVDIQDYVGSSPSFPPGTHFYAGAWNPLDRFLVSKDLLTGESWLQVDPESYEIFSPNYLFIEKTIKDPKTGHEVTSKIPNRFDFMTGDGYSDHLPIALKLVQNTLRN